MAASSARVITCSIQFAPMQPKAPCAALPANKPSFES
jgi:hypothetical protein